MVFLVDMGTDLYGAKVNKRLEFVLRPTMQELLIKATDAFDLESRLSRPVGVPDLPFKIETVQIYNDILHRWSDLYSSSQLYDGCQLFCFQPAAPWHNDDPGTIPAPSSTSRNFNGGSLLPSHLSDKTMMPSTSSEKTKSVFFRYDKGLGFLTYDGLMDAFKAAGMPWQHSTVGHYFAIADTNCSGRITYDEWMTFGARYPLVIDGLFHQHHAGAAMDRSAANVKACREREEELRQLYARATEDRLKAEREAAMTWRTVV